VLKSKYDFIYALLAGNLASHATGEIARHAARIGTQHLSDRPDYRPRRWWDDSIRIKMNFNKIIRSNAKWVGIVRNWDFAMAMM
jgi:hypothetical protein